MIRFATWAAVSTKAQATADKISLEHQIERAGYVGHINGWHSGPVFALPGESRTQYIDLGDAENDIPELREMLDAAQRREFDVLVAYDTNRFRNLLKQIYWALADYGVQLYFVTQPVPIQDPTRYDPNNSDTLLLIINVAAITSDSELAQIRRRYNAGMPARVTEKGLPIQIPYGYRRPQLIEATRQAIANAVPEQIPEICVHLIAAKDMLLAGKSTSQIVDYLVEKELQPPRGAIWHARTVIEILRNPFYAGSVRWGASKVVKDRRNQTHRRNRKIPASEIRIATGKHVPLWDATTRDAMVEIIASRTTNYRGRLNNQFTGLLRCGICGGTLWRYGNGPRSTDRLLWRCHAATTGHPTIGHADLLEQMATRLKDTLPGYLSGSPIPLAIPNVEDKRKEIEEIGVQRKRIEDAYIAGLFPIIEFSARVAGLDARRAKLLAEHDQRAATLSIRREWLRKFKESSANILANLPAWLENSSPDETNAALRNLLEIITIEPGPRVILKYR